MRVPHPRATGLLCQCEVIATAGGWAGRGGLERTGNPRGGMFWVRPSHPDHTVLLPSSSLWIFSAIFLSSRPPGQDSNASSSDSGGCGWGLGNTWVSALASRPESTRGRCGDGEERGARGRESWVAGQLGSWAAGPWRVLEEGAAGLLSWEPTCFCTGKRADGNRRLEQINPVIAARRWPGHRGQRAWAREGP